MRTTGAQRATLADRNFRRYFISQAVNRLGAMLTPTAFAFAVLHLKNSPTALSKVLGAEIAATVVCVMIGGWAADRFGRRRIILGAWAGEFVMTSAVAVLLFTGTARIWSLTVLAVLAGACAGFTLPAGEGMVAQLAPPDKLQQANSLMAIVRNAGSIAGPVVATLIVAAAATAWAFVVDALTYAVAATFLSRVRIPPPDHERQPMLRELRDGWSEFVSRRWLWTIVVAFSGLNAIQFGGFRTLGPVIAKNDERMTIPGWGITMGAWAVGMLVSAFVMLKLPLPRPLRMAMAGCSLFALPVATLGFAPYWPVVTIAAFIAGIGTEMFGTAWAVAMMENVPTTVYSRVSSYDMLGSFIAMPIGIWLYGWLATVAPIRDILLVSAVVYAVIALSTFAVPEVWRMGRTANGQAQ